MATKHHILLLGGTGICGTIFTRAALEAGHKLTLYVRTPSKIPADLSSSPLITVIQGELGDEEGLSKAAACEADTFISLAGPALGKREGSVRAQPFCKIHADFTKADHKCTENPLPSPARKRHIQTRNGSFNRFILRTRGLTKLQMVLGYTMLYTDHRRGYIWRN